MRWKKFELPGELHQSSSAILVIGETQAPACPEDEDCEDHSLQHQQHADCRLQSEGGTDLTEVVTGGGGGELSKNTDHRSQLQQTVEVHHQVDLTEEDFTLDYSDCKLPVTA